MGFIYSLPRKTQFLFLFFASFFGAEVPGVTTHDGSTLVMETLSMRPRVFHIPNFLSADECDVIVARADTQMERSGVYLTTKVRRQSFFSPFVVPIR